MQGIFGSNEVESDEDKAQEQTSDDSQLQTPQPDAPIETPSTEPPAHTESEPDVSEEDQESKNDEPSEPVEEPQFHDTSRGLHGDPFPGRQTPPEREDQVEAHERRQAQLAEERERHNERTGDGSRPSGSH